MDMRSALRRSEFGQRVLDARKHAKMTQDSLARAVGMSQGTLAETEKQASSSTFIAQIAWATGVNAYWLATGEGAMLPPDQTAIDADQRKQIDGHAAMRMAISVLGTLLLDMDSESRKLAGHLMAEMASNPDGRWGEHLSDLIEKVSIPKTWDAIGIYVRAGNYHVSTPESGPVLTHKSGAVPTKAIHDSTLPTGASDATGSDRDKDQSGSGNTAAGSG
jgi:transcriptional regulator with XRE-family HTH domain